jgi:hypothetical protein
MLRAGILNLIRGASTAHCRCKNVPYEGFIDLKEIDLKEKRRGL